MLRYTAQASYNNPKSIGAIGFPLEARDSLIIDHLPKVKYIADRIASKLPPSIERDDLYGAGVLGLMDAVEPEILLRAEHAAHSVPGVVDELETPRLYAYACFAG